MEEINRYWKGRHRSSETKIKISQKLKGRMPKNFKKNQELSKSKESIEKIIKKLTGHPVSTATREKISKANKGRKHTEETKRKISENSYWKGKKMPPFTKERLEKMRVAQLERHKNSPMSKETREKMSESRRGEKSWRWISDRTKLKKKDERNDPAYQEWRKNCLIRDNYQCKICGLSYTKEHKLIVHHILPWRDFPELRYEINNGIALCRIHHPRKREDEKRLIPVLQGLVEAKGNNLSIKSVDIWAEDMKEAILTALKEGNRTKAEELNDELVYQLGYGLDLDAEINEDPAI